MPESFANRRLRNAKGQFLKTTIKEFPDALGKSFVAKGSGTVIMRTNLEAARKSAAELARVGTRAIEDSHNRASAIQARMQAAALGQYTRASTGRFARGIRTRVEKFSSNGKVGSAIIVTATNYRETRFLTNIGGSGHFKEFPVQPYRIYAKGAEGSDTMVDPMTGIVTRTANKAAVRLAKSLGAGRLKVPRRSAFFTAAPVPGRGGGERRTINDILGPREPGDTQGAFFFYPLWVDHPGFQRDVISEVALAEGALYQEEVLTAFADEVDEWSTGNEKAVETKQMVVSRVIPLPGLSVLKARDSDLVAFARGFRRDPPYVVHTNTIINGVARDARGRFVRGVPSLEARRKP